jgi:hypothetical protein
MPATKEYKAQKGYRPEHKGKVATWTVPTTLAEALAPNPDNSKGEAFFANEADVVRAAMDQVNIKKGHIISGMIGEDVVLKEGETLPSWEDAVKAAREFVWRPRAKSEGGSKRAPKEETEIGRRVKEKTSDLSETSEADLRTLARFGVITQERFDAEIARRKEARAARK